MPNTIQIDFIGMGVVMIEGAVGTGTMALLNERRHLHLISYLDAVTNLPAVKGLLAGDYAVKDHERGTVSVVDPEARLPNIVNLSRSTVRSASRLAKTIRVRFALPTGILRSRVPVQPKAEAPWVFAAEPPRRLTDRTQFVGATSAVGNLTVTTPGADDIVVALEGNVFKILVMAIDADVGDRVVGVRPGLTLCEFQLLYELTEQPGPLPVFSPTDFADPDAPICPQALVVIP